VEAEIKTAQRIILALVFETLPFVGCSAPVRSSLDTQQAVGRGKEFVFAGGTTLRVKVDEMTDRKTCTVSIRGDGIYAEISNASAIVIGVGYMVVGRALLRVGDSAPFSLPFQDLHYRFVLPKNRSLEVTKGLLSGKSIPVRFDDSINGGEVNLEIQPGDFRGAYNQATDVCGWSSPPANPVPKNRKNPSR